jgi:hypothetical protein
METEVAKELTDREFMLELIKRGQAAEGQLLGVVKDRIYAQAKIDCAKAVVAYWQKMIWWEMEAERVRGDPGAHDDEKFITA